MMVAFSSLLAVTLPTPLGDMVAMASATALEYLYFADHPPLTTLAHFNGPRLSVQQLTSLSSSASAIVRLTSEWVESYFAGEKPDASVLPVSSAGSAFSHAVFHELAVVASGESISYQQLAYRVGTRWEKPVAPRAVASVLAHNRVLLIRPCHRVIASSGALSGYAGGVERKRALLQWEGALSGQNV